ncbi:alpha/beta hydrolase family protein [Terrisporobacter sp.]
MDSKRIFVDPEIELEDGYFPNLYEIKIKSHDEELIGAILTPGGKGPHPTVILLHGFPGYEDNHDLAHSLRRCGLNVLIFHYRGCWGVGGEFTFSNCIEDVKESINFVTSEKNIKTFSIDKDNIFLVGHSMGGFLTLTNCLDERIKASVAISPYDFGLKGCVMKEDENELRDGIEMFSGAIDPLNNTDTMSLIREVIINGNKWSLLNKAEELSKKKVLITAATRDVVGPNKLHHIPLMREIYKYSKENVQEVYVDTDHSYSSKRVLLTKTIAEYIEKIYKQS